MTPATGQHHYASYEGDFQGGGGCAPMSWYFLPGRLARKSRGRPRDVVPAKQAPPPVVAIQIGQHKPPRPVSPATARQARP